MDIKEVVGILEDLAFLLELDGANPFEVRAFQNGAQNLEDWSGDLEEMVKSETLQEIDGIGKGLALVITELVQAGEATRHQELLAKYPSTLLELLAVPGLGAKKIQRLYRDLSIASLDELEKAAKAEQIRDLPGFGARSEERILTGIERARRYPRR